MMSETEQLAYDRFAEEAMKILLQGYSNYDEIAQHAWRVADAMMEERRKRNVEGKPPHCQRCGGQHPTPPLELTPEQIAELGKKKDKT